MISTPNSTVRPGNGAIGGTPRRINRESGTRAVDREELLPPARRGFQNIPNDEVLFALIERAVNALKHGVYWDRGSILNINV